MENPLNQEKNEKSLKEFKKILEEKKICYEKIPCFGKNSFTQVLFLTLLGDWISFYLAILNKVDPAPVKKIQRIKKK